MKSISIDAELSLLYTNHCIRATSVTILDERGFEARHIMSLSGHRSESSIRSYSRTGAGIKRKMSNQLSNFCDENATFDFGVDFSSPERDQSVPGNNAIVPVKKQATCSSKTANLASFLGHSAQSVQFNNCTFNFNQS